MNKRDSQFRRTMLPYGTWTLKDGSTVLFNRNYAPMHKRAPDGQISSWPKPFANDRTPGSETWVNWTRQDWLYDDGTPERDKRQRGISALAAWGLEP